MRSRESGGVNLTDPKVPGSHPVDGIPSGGNASLYKVHYFLYYFAHALHWL